jgi:hypothetical protein
MIVQPTDTAKRAALVDFPREAGPNCKQAPPIKLNPRTYLHFKAIGNHLIDLGKKASKRGNIQMSVDAFAEQQLITTLNMPSRKRTADDISYLEKTCASRPYFQKFSEEYGRQVLRSLLSSCYYE